MHSARYYLCAFRTCTSSRSTDCVRHWIIGYLSFIVYVNSFWLANNFATHGGYVCTLNLKEMKFALIDNATFCVRARTRRLEIFANKGWWLQTRLALGNISLQCASRTVLNVLINWRMFLRGTFWGAANKGIPLKGTKLPLEPHYQPSLVGDAHIGNVRQLEQLMSTSRLQVKTSSVQVTWAKKSKIAARTVPNKTRHLSCDKRTWIVDIKDIATIYCHCKRKRCSTVCQMTRKMGTSFKPCCHKKRH